MGIFSTFNYDDRTGYGTKYGDAPRFAFNVEPFDSVATNYGEVSLTWAQPQGKYTRIRLVRNQDGYPETEEDGVILWSWLGETNEYGEVPVDSNFPVRITSFVDQETPNVPGLLSGVFAYYRIWLYTELEEWVSAGDTYVLVPKSHSYVTPDGGLEITTHDKFMDLLPRVFTSASQSPIDEVDKTSVLYSFMSGMSFTLDEVMSYADSLLPEFTGRYLSPELVTLKSESLNLQLDSFAASQNQKRLIREAYYIYNHKGTETATTTYIEGLTGWAPNLIESPNKMLSPQDSTFFKGVGNWRASGACTLSSVQERTGLTENDVTYATDFYYSGKVVVTGTTASVKNGTGDVINTACRIEAGTNYNLIAKFASDSGIDVTGTVTWYDRKGQVIKSQTSPALTSTSSWIDFSFNDLATGSSSLVAPGGARYISSYSIASNVVTVSTGTQVHGMQVGESITVTDSPVTELNGTHTVTAVTATEISWAETLPNATSTLTSGVLTSNTYGDADFASVEFAFDGTGTIYVDMVQLADRRYEEYYEGKSLVVFLNPTKTNWIKNPSFNPSNPDSWYLIPPTIGGPVITSTITYVEPSTLEDSVDGTHMAEISTVLDEPVYVGTDIGEVTPGKFYTFSVYLATQELNAIEQNAVLNLSLYDPTLFLDVENPTETELADNLVISSSHTIADITNDWVRYQATAFVPDSLPRIWMRVSAQFEGSGNTILMDDAQVEIGYTASDHFDGDVPASFGAVWEGGIVNASNARSHVYPHKGIKLTRLTENLREFIPYNTPYIIETYAGVETRTNPQ